MHLKRPWDNLLFVLDLHSCKHSLRWRWITVENYYWAWSQWIFSLLLNHHHDIYSWIRKGRRQGRDLKNWKHNLSLISFLSYVHLSLLKSMVSISSHVLCCAKLLSHVWLSATPCTVARLLCPWDSPGENTGVSCHALLQGIFPWQGSNPHLLHCMWILDSLSHQGSPSHHGY